MQFDKNKIAMIDALNNFFQAHDRLATAWIDLQSAQPETDLSLNFPFAGNFDAHKVKKWIDSSIALLEAKDSSITLYNRTYATKVFAKVEDANKFMFLRPEFSVIGENAEGVHLALTEDKGKKS